MFLLMTSIQPFPQAIFVPIQGFINALAYGWTRGDFLRVMSSRHGNENQASTQALSPTTSLEETEEETDTEQEGHSWKDLTRGTVVPGKQPGTAAAEDRDEIMTPLCN